MRQPQGYLYIADPDAPVPVTERDTITCGHCQRMVEVKPGTGATVYLIFDSDRWQYREVPGAFCRACMRPICIHCHETGHCVPWERMIDRMEGRDRFLRVVLGG